MEQEFDVEIKEVLSRVQKVKAESLDDAINKAKVVDKKHSKIIRNCDFAIIYYLDDDNLNNGYRYIKNWKKNNRYSFEDRVLSQNADCKLQEILEYEQGWNCVRDEYIKLKNRNRDTNKKSFILYLESIHNVYNHIQQRLEDEEDNLPRGLTYLNPW